MDIKILRKIKRKPISFKNRLLFKKTKKSEKNHDIPKNKKLSSLSVLLKLKNKRTGQRISKTELKNNDKQYIKQLENENARLRGEYKIIQRQIRRELSTYLEPIQNIYSNVDFKEYSKQDLSYIKTQLESFLNKKGYKIFQPNKLTMHDKAEVIVEDLIKTNSKEKDGLIESVILIGIKDSSGTVITPARVRIYKGSENNGY